MSDWLGCVPVVPTCVLGLQGCCFWAAEAGMVGAAAPPSSPSHAPISPLSNAPRTFIAAQVQVVQVVTDDIARLPPPPAAPSLTKSRSKSPKGPLLISLHSPSAKHRISHQSKSSSVASSLLPSTTHPRDCCFGPSLPTYWCLGQALFSWTAGTGLAYDIDSIIESKHLLVSHVLISLGPCQRDAVCLELDGFRTTGGTYRVLHGCPGVPQSNPIQPNPNQCNPT